MTTEAPITKDSAIPDVLLRFPACRPVLERLGLRDRDGQLGPSQPVGWFASQRGTPLDQLLRELNEAAQPAGFPPVDSDEPKELKRDEPAASTCPGEAAGEVEKKIWLALERCVHPQFPGASIVELGLILVVMYDARSGAAEIVMTLTSPHSPTADAMVEQVEELAHSVPDVQDVRVRLTFDRPWPLERVRSDVRQRIGVEW